MSKFRVGDVAASMGGEPVRVLGLDVCHVEECCDTRELILIDPDGNGPQAAHAEDYEQYF